MMLRELAEFFSDLEDVISEPARATVVHRFCRMFGAHLMQKDEQAYKLWLSRDRSRFVHNCGIRDNYPELPDIGISVLERWANKWLRVEKFRMKEGSEDWRPITPEQNALRVTMIHDLKKYVDEHLTKP